MIWNFYSRTNSRQVSWLADPRAMTAFPIPLESVTVHDNGHALPAYSDEIVQDFHLFPFYLLSALFRAAAAPDASSIVMGDILASSGLLCKDH